MQAGWQAFEQSGPECGRQKRATNCRTFSFAAKSRQLEATTVKLFSTVIARTDCLALVTLQALSN
jgi:hypothetical protein